MKNKNINLSVILTILAVFLILTACPELGAQSDNILNLTPMKNQFIEYFDIGNIFNPGDISGGKVSNERLTRHYNVLTAENNMKPSHLSTGRGSYNFQNADNMVNAAVASGFKVVGHTLLWHSQIPQWQRDLRNNTVSKAAALDWMKTYITDVVSHFKGKVYLWDVLNEAFPDGGYTAASDWKNSMRGDSQNGNPWFMKIGAEFVFEAFLAARQADPNAILYYNDYNLNQPNKAAMVRNMVRDVNTQWAGDSRYDGKKLIQGIGMQSHHNIDVPASQVKASLDLFRPLGVEISISELDVLSQSWGDFSRGTDPTSGGKAKAAELYGEYFKVFLDNADIIKRVTFWGVLDNESWRSSGLPLLFDSRGIAKDAYFKVIEALENKKRN